MGTSKKTKSLRATMWSKRQTLGSLPPGDRGQTKALTRDKPRLKSGGRPGTDRPEGRDRGLGPKDSITSPDCISPPPHPRTPGNRKQQDRRQCAAAPLIPSRHRPGPPLGPGGFGPAGPGGTGPANSFWGRRHRPGGARRGSAASARPTPTPFGPGGFGPAASARPGPGGARRHHRPGPPPQRRPPPKVLLQGGSIPSRHSRQ